ncbi:MAG: RNA degradosome polyphosphate kinase, partial [Actinomycetia bacterium]|nr:RNA degradosome polyphosphate kinase [Actinomycetes bacterium]
MISPSLSSRNPVARRWAVVQAPRPLPRALLLPSEASDEPGVHLVFLSSIIHACMGQLFPGMTIEGTHQFRVTRNSELFVDAEEEDDLLRALEGELHGRSYGDEVRLEVDETCPDAVVRFLQRTFTLPEEAVYRVNGPVNLHRLMAAPDLIERPDLKYPGFVPGVPAVVATNNKIFDTIARGDVLLFHPFQSFAPVVDFLRQAAADPDVLAIKQTLYRT